MATPLAGSRPSIPGTILLLPFDEKVEYNSHGRSLSSWLFAHGGKLLSSRLPYGSLQSTVTQPSRNAVLLAAERTTASGSILASSVLVILAWFIPCSEAIIARCLLATTQMLVLMRTSSSRGVLEVLIQMQFDGYKLAMCTAVRSFEVLELFTNGDRLGIRNSGLLKVKGHCPST